MLASAGPTSPVFHVDGLLLAQAGEIVATVWAPPWYPWRTGAAARLFLASDRAARSPCTAERLAVALGEPVESTQEVTVAVEAVDELLGVLMLLLLVCVRLLDRVDATTAPAVV